MANLADTISAGIKDAMRAKDRERLSALRDIKSKILLEATKEGAGDTVDDARRPRSTQTKDAKTLLPKSAHRLRSFRNSFPPHSPKLKSKPR